MELTFGVSSSIRANDNFGLDDPSPGTSFLWDNELSFGLYTETQFDRLSLDLRGVLRLADIPGNSENFDFDEPSAQLTYAREGANSRFEVGASYRQVDLDFSDPVGLILDDIDDDGILDDGDLILDTGTRKTRSYGLEFETGLNDPFGFGVVLDYNKTEYSGTTDPGLFDRKTYSTELFTKLRLSPLAQGRFAVSHEKYEADDFSQEERTTNDARFEVTYDISPVTTLETMIGYRDIKETTNILPSTTEDGFIGSVALVRDLKTGSAGIEFESDLSITGQRNSLTFSRSLEFPTGNLSASLGATHGDASDDTDVIGSIAYEHILPNGTITATASRAVATDEDGDDNISMLVGLGYETSLTPLSSMLFELDFVSKETIGTGITDQSEAATFRATYNRQLTSDWNMSAGYEYRTFDETNDSFRDSNEVFVKIGRKFSIRP